MKKQQKINYYFTGIIILCLVAGYLAGMLFYKSKTTSQREKFNNIFRTLGSEVVPSIISYGKVTKITGNDITIAFNQSVITVKMKDGAKISALSSTPREEDDPSLGLGFIETGDMLKINISVDSEGNFIGSSAIDFGKK